MNFKKLYGKEYDNFTNVQKAYLEKKKKSK